MKHFSQPLSVFVQNELLGGTTVRDAEQAIISPSLQSLVDTLHHRVFMKLQDHEQGSAQAPQNPGELLACISSSRVSFHRCARRMRTAFAVARIAERIALGDAPQDTVLGHTAEGRAIRFDSLDALSVVLRGRADSRMEHICMAVG